MLQTLELHGLRTTAFCRASLFSYNRLVCSAREKTQAVSCVLDICKGRRSKGQDLHKTTVTYLSSMRRSFLTKPVCCDGL